MTCTQPPRAVEKKMRHDVVQLTKNAHKPQECIDDLLHCVDLVCAPLTPPLPCAWDQDGVDLLHAIGAQGEVPEGQREGWATPLEIEEDNDNIKYTITPGVFYLFRPAPVVENGRSYCADFWVGKCISLTTTERGFKGLRVQYWEPVDRKDPFGYNSPRSEFKTSETHKYDQVFQSSVEYKLKPLVGDKKKKHATTHKHIRKIACHDKKWIRYWMGMWANPEMAQQWEDMGGDVAEVEDEAPLVN
jgi:hypothetical protein